MCLFILQPSPLQRLVAPSIKLKAESRAPFSDFVLSAPTPQPHPASFPPSTSLHFYLHHSNSSGLSASTLAFILNRFPTHPLEWSPPPSTSLHFYLHHCNSSGLSASTLAFILNLFPTHPLEWSPPPSMTFKAQCDSNSAWIVYHFSFFKNIYLAVLGLSCSTWDLWSSLWHMRSLVVHMESSSLARDRTQAPCTGSSEP